MIWWGYNEASKVKEIDELYVATDDKRITEECRKYNMKYIMASKEHKNGTERTIEVSKSINGDYYLVIMGDEPLIRAKDIEEFLKEGEIFVLTYEEELATVAVVIKIDNNTVELKNIATVEKYRNQGYGKKMIKYLFDNYKSRYNKMLVGTTENNIPFYVKQGLRKDNKKLLYRQL